MKDVFDYAPRTRKMVVNRLRGARAKIENPAQWTRGQFVRQELNMAEPAYCAIGAVLHAGTPGVAQRGAITALDTLARETGVGGIISLNDGPGGGNPGDPTKYGHAAVLAVFDRAIERLESV